VGPYASATQTALAYIAFR